MFHTCITDSSVNEGLDDSNSAISSTENRNTTGNYDLSHLQSLLSLNMSTHVYKNTQNIFNKIIPWTLLKDCHTQFKRVKPNVNEYDLNTHNLNSLHGFEDYVCVPEEAATLYERLNSQRKFVKID